MRKILTLFLLFTMNNGFSQTPTPCSPNEFFTYLPSEMNFGSITLDEDVVEIIGISSQGTMNYSYLINVPNSFEISNDNIVYSNSISGNGLQQSFYLRAKANLPNGSYQEIMTITYNNGPIPCQITLNTVIQCSGINPPVVNTQQIFCGNTTIADLVAIGDPGKTVIWTEFPYGIPLAQNHVITTGTYYVGQFEGNCMSTKIPVVVTVNPIPSALSSQTISVCGNQTLASINLNQANNATLKWYSSVTSTSALPLTTQIASGLYYVSQTINNCESARATITFNNINLNAPTIASQTFCSATPVSNIIVNSTSGATVKWYNSATSTNQLTTISTSGIYFVEQTLNNCTSIRTQVQININGNIVAPTANANQSFCGSTTVSDLIATATSGNTIGWFSSATATTPLTNTINITSGTYYVGQSNGTCWSAKIPVVVTVNPIPSALSSQTISVCGNQTLASINLNQANNATLKWYSSVTSSSALPLTTQIASGLYYVSQTINNCESARATITFNSVTVPATPTGSATQTFQDGATIANLVLDQNSVIWYATHNDALLEVNPLATSTLLIDGNSYFGVISINNCTSLPFEVTVNVTLSNNDFIKGDLTYYPNPIEDILNINYSDNITQINIFDILGKQKKSFDTNSKEININLSDLSTGIYLVELKTSTKKQVIKIVKK